MKEMLKKADAILGYDLLQLCLEGPKEKLDDTVFSQPALYVANLAAVEKLRQDDPQAVDSCSATAGNSSCQARMDICVCQPFTVIFLLSMHGQENPMLCHSTSKSCLLWLIQCPVWP